MTSTHQGDVETEREAGDAFFGEFGDSIKFNSGDEYVPDAAQIAWRPKSIAFRQSHNQEERYFLNLYLRWVFEKKPFEFSLPMKIARADKDSQPDFAITENGHQYGLEVTRATTQRNESAKTELMKKGSGFRMESGSCLNSDDRNFDPKSCIHPIKDLFFDEPIIGVEPEREWARLTANRILAKHKKLTKNYIHFLPQCDLVLYSAWPILDVNAAIGLLKSEYDLLVSAPHSIFFKRIALVCESWAIFDPLGREPQIYTSDLFPLSGSSGINGSADAL